MRFWLLPPSSYSLIWVWEWLRALLLSRCCLLCGSFKVWPYQSWHLNAKENAGQACSSRGCRHQTIAVWNNGCITWIHWARTESLFPHIPYQCFRQYPVLWVLPPDRNSATQPNKIPRHLLLILFLFFSFFIHIWGKALVCTVGKCGETRLESQGRRMKLLLHTVKRYLWLKARDT